MKLFKLCISARAMERKSGSQWSRDELLSAYEQGVWTFLALVGLAVVGLVFWLGYMLL